MVISLLERMKYERVEPNTIVLTAAIDSLAREGGGVYTGTYFNIYCHVFFFCYLFYIYTVTWREEGGAKDRDR